MVTRRSESIALWKRLMKPNLNALFFQEVTLPVYIGEKTVFCKKEDISWNILMKN